MAQAVALHPEVTQDPRVVRWILTGRHDSFRDVVAAAECPLQHLVGEGILSYVDGGAGWITTTLAPGHQWRDVTSRVRNAVAECVVDAAPRRVTDQDLREVAQEILEREVAPVAGAHGGRIEIVGVEDHTVRVSLDGACHGCPAAKVTLQDRFQRSLARSVPDARVVEDERSAAHTSARGLGPLRLPFPRFRGR